MFASFKDKLTYLNFIALVKLGFLSIESFCCQLFGYLDEIFKQLIKALTYFYFYMTISLAIIYTYDPTLWDLLLDHFIQNNPNSITLVPPPQTHVKGFEDFSALTEKINLIANQSPSWYHDAILISVNSICIGCAFLLFVYSNKTGV